MVDPIEKTGFRATDNIMDGDFFTSKDKILEEFKESLSYQCGDCYEEYEDKFDAEECCKADLEQNG